MITGCTIKKCFVVVFIIAYNAIIIDSVGKVQWKTLRKIMHNALDLKCLMA